MICWVFFFWIFWLLKHITFYQIGCIWIITWIFILHLNSPPAFYLLLLHLLFLLLIDISLVFYTVAVGGFADNAVRNGLQNLDLTSTQKLRANTAASVGVPVLTLPKGTCAISSITHNKSQFISCGMLHTMRNMIVSDYLCEAWSEVGCIDDSALHSVKHWIFSWLIF